MIEKLKKLIEDGEGLTVEFKRCENDIAANIYETVSAFSNRYGGYILLGVEDNGVIKNGVKDEAVSKIKKDFVNALNNQQRFSPTLFLSLEEVNIDGKIILWCFVPPHSQIVMFNGKIFDRAEDGDMDITRNSEMVAHIHRRKAAEHSEREVFPYAKESDFDFVRLMPKVRRLAAGRNEHHPWIAMTDEEIIRSAGLYHEDLKTGKSGYNLAAILLFGRDEVIRSCTANYVTDALCRRKDLDRYDDRLLVTTNLIDAYEQLVEFIAKHTLDRFHLEDGHSVSLQSKISREIVSNILVHREYTSAFPAKIIIERGRIVTENWSLPKMPGRIDPNNFVPHPKNPLLSDFFINIGRADRLGSGVRNLFKFTKLYSGSEPELIDGDVFKTIVPIYENGNGEIYSDIDGINDGINDGIKNGITELQKNIIGLICGNPKITTKQIAENLNLSESHAESQVRVLKKSGIVGREGSRKNGIWVIECGSGR
jgi:ATP-dependent DNA helicase RecG